MEEYSRKRHEVSGYDFVYSPHITKSELFEISGHLDWFARVDVSAHGTRRWHHVLPEADELSFPHVDLQVQPTQLRDLPLRYFEFGSVYRYEKSGVVHGLTRVRA